MSGWGLGGVAALGAFHGINPAMGWLFAVAIALQGRSRRALGLALPPIAVGHALSVALVVLLVEEARVFASDTAIRVAGAVLLAAFAVWKLVRARHPRWVGMRVSALELALWSFLMSTAHGAGLMLVPLLMGVQVRHTGFLPSNVGAPALAVGVHTLAMVAVAGLIAVAVYEIFGVGILLRGWLNLDRVWAFALLIAAMTTLVM